ncbi:MAG: tyrosine-protein phosphatase [Thermoleophilaceae bacterium]
MREQQADLHFHALPGLDDGPATLDDSLELIREAQAEGTTRVVATPHVRSDFVTDVSDLHERVRELRSAVGAARIGVAVRPGGELGHDMVGRLSQRELDSIAQGPPGGRWLLLETPFEGMGEDFHAAADELRDGGFSIVVAHPERSADAHLDDSAGLRHQIAAGAGAQVNAQSITGAHGAEARTAAFSLVREGLVTIVGSDAHGPTRPPLLAQARRALAQAGLHAAACRALTVSGPLSLLAQGLAPAERGSLLVA